MDLTDSPHLRTATATDAEAISAIYNYYVEHTTATYALEPELIQERLAWFDARSEKHPAIVAETPDGQVIAWGSLSPHRPRGAYQRTAEISVYVHREFHRRGLGRAILLELIARAQAAGLHALLGGCSSESLASIELHKSLGFIEVGRFRQVGHKFGRWLDVVYMEYLIPSADLQGITD